LAELNLPNGLTILRIFFVPLLVVVLLTREPNLTLFGLPFHFEMWGVLILLVAASTDLADGYLARKRHEITTLGILLDPIADKLLISAAFISLVAMGLAPAWMVVIVIGRDFTVSGLRNIAASEGLPIPASALGKTKMVLEVVTACMLILAAKHHALRLLGTMLLWLVVISAVVSAVHYFMVFWSQVDGRIKQRQRNLMTLEQEKKTEDVTARP
jgi:CDP-diacylglycerol--glycerol-3-phosphate 3-phosphatidyltransferase